MVGYVRRGSDLKIAFSVIFVRYSYSRTPEGILQVSAYIYYSMAGFTPESSGFDAFRGGNFIAPCQSLEVYQIVIKLFRKMWHSSRDIRHKIS